MRALLQRVTHPSVRVNGELVGEIGPGLVVFVGIARGDLETDGDYLAEKLANLRIFPDAEGRFNLSALDTKADLLPVSQFTLCAETRKWRRPSFIEAAGPEEAKELFESFLRRLSTTGLKVTTGRFQAHMLVEVHNDRPVTIMLDSFDRSPNRKGDPKASRQHDPI